MRGDTQHTLDEAEAWEEPQDDDTVVLPDSVSDGNQTVADGQMAAGNDLADRRAEADAHLPLDTVNWTNALASMSIPDSDSFGAWIDAISSTGLPGPHDHEVAQLFPEDDSQIGFDSDEQVVL